MIILGIDPGFHRCGFGVVERVGSTIAHIAHGCTETSREDDLGNRLLSVAQHVENIIEQYSPQRVAIEKLFFVKNVKTGIAVAHARGVVLYVCAKKGLPVVEMTPSQIKMGLTGYGAADKKQMQRMVALELGLKEIPKPDDAADALAIAICASSINVPVI